MLRLREGRKIDLEKTAQIDRSITAYLRECFVVGPQGGKPFALQWVGKEVSIKYAWLYFEIPIPPTAKALVVTNRMHFALLKDQINTVTFREGREHVSVRFSREHPTRHLVLPLRPAGDDADQAEGVGADRRDHD